MTSAARSLLPRVHFTAGRGWMNDPHGLTFHDGRYHLFFQFAPDSLEWQQECHWGHATSTDLIHWERRPIALAPGDGDTGCWSGAVALTDAGAPWMFYTSVSGDNLELGSVRVAHTDDPDWDAWTKGAVVVRFPRRDTRVFRDPMVFRDGDVWRMLVGYGDREIAGAEVFESADLSTWTYDGPLCIRPTWDTDPWTGEAWECPQLIRGARDSGNDTLLVSVWSGRTTHYVAAGLGAYADGRFSDRAWQRMTAGEGHYAASAFTDAEGRSCVIFWIRGISEPGIWAGALSVPYVVRATEERIHLEPHPAVAEARRQTDGAGSALDLVWRPGERGVLRLAGADGTERAVVEKVDGQLTVTTSGSRPVLVGHRSPSVRLIADTHVLEVVADDGLVGLPLRDAGTELTPHSDSPFECWELA